MTVPVTLYVYDLSNGIAKNVSPFILGRRIEGIWHTSIVIFNNEYFYGGHGIACCIPGTTQLGEPLRKQVLGVTAITQEIFEDFLAGSSNSKFHGSSYNLLKNNCNNFSDEAAKFLLGHGIDEDIVTLPQKVLSSPMGPFLRSHLEKMSNIAPTDSHDFRNIRQSNGSVCNGNGHIPRDRHQHVTHSSTPTTSIFYSAEFSRVSLDREDVLVLQQADPLLPSVITTGPLSAEDLPLLLAVRSGDPSLFCKVISLLAHKPGFVRLLLGDRDLYTSVLLEMTPERPVLANNLIAGLNQAGQGNKNYIDKILNQVTANILSDEGTNPEMSLLYSRLAYNLSGCNLNEDQVIGLGSALLHTLPESLECVDSQCSTDSDKNLGPESSSSGSSSDKTRESSIGDKQIDELTMPAVQSDKFRLVLRTMFLLMVKNRQVIDLCTAMDKTFEIFYVHSDLKPLALKIVQLQS